jgi:hypothetical protein
MEMSVHAPSKEYCWEITTTILYAIEELLLRNGRRSITDSVEVKVIIVCVVHALPENYREITIHGVPVNYLKKSTAWNSKKIVMKLLLGNCALLLKNHI